VFFQSLQISFLKKQINKQSKHKEQNINAKQKFSDGTKGKENNMREKRIKEKFGTKLECEYLFLINTFLF